MLSSSERVITFDYPSNKNLKIEKAWKVYAKPGRKYEFPIAADCDGLNIYIDDATQLPTTEMFDAKGRSNDHLTGIPFYNLSSRDRLRKSVRSVTKLIMVVEERHFEEAARGSRDADRE